MKTVELTPGDVAVLLEALQKLRQGPEAQIEFGINRTDNSRIITKIHKLERKLTHDK